MRLPFDGSPTRLESRDLRFIAERTRQAYNLAADRYHSLFANEIKEKDYDRALLDDLAERLPRHALVLDAGCGPSGHMARYLADKGLRTVGADISDRCASLAHRHNPDLVFHQADMVSLPYRDQQFDAVISFYSVIDTPKADVPRLFDEMARVTRPGGLLLVAVKAGLTEGWTHDLLGIETDIYFTLFSEHEIRTYLEKAGWKVDRLERRSPYDFEISSDRIYAMASRTA